MVPPKELRQRDPSVVGQRGELREVIANEQAGRALGPHVHVVADLDALGRKGEQVDRSCRLDEVAQHRAGDVTEELQPREMAALVLFDHEGLKAKEVGRILNLSEGAVRRYVFEGRRKVKDILGPYLRGEQP